MPKFRLECEFCGSVLEEKTAETLKEQSQSHFEDQHYDDLLSSFGEGFAGKTCRNECGYEFSIGVDEIAGYECPDCGYDHFPAFVQQYVYWRMEQISE